MNKTRITPFLILNPLIAAWAVYSLVAVQIRGGFAVIMSGFFLSITGLSTALLVIDRFFFRGINLWVVSVIEILILFASYRVADWYWYG